MYIFCRQFNFLIAGPYIYIHKLILLIKTCFCSSAEVREKLDLVDTKYDDYFFTKQPLSSLRPSLTSSNSGLSHRQHDYASTEVGT